MKLEQLGNQITIESAGYWSGGTDPDITVLENGNLVVVWTEWLGQPTDEFDDRDNGVYGRILDSDGVPISEIFELTDDNTFNQRQPQVVALPGGGFAAGWMNVSRFGNGPTDTDTFIRFFNDDGTAINNISIDVFRDTPGIFPEDDSRLLEMVPLSPNRFAVILENNQTYVYDTGGRLVVDLGVRADDIVQLANGNILSAMSSGLDTIQLTLMSDQFDTPAGVAGVYDVLQFTVKGDPLLRIDRDNLELAALGGGGFALAYVEGDENGSRLNLEFMSAVGQFEYTAPSISRNFAGNAGGGDFDMISLSGGGIALAVVKYNSTRDTRSVDLYLFDENGREFSKLQVGNKLVADQANPSLTELPDGTIALAFTDLSAEDSNPMQLAFFEVTGPKAKLLGTEGNDTLRGIGGNDRILGLGGDDKITGDGGNDVLKGGDGDDNLLGGDGKDALRGGAGNDVLKGGTGNDGLGGGDGNDRLLGEGGRDILGGGKGNDRLVGGTGNDVLKGGIGRDTATGGAGDDTFIFVNGHAGADTITDFDEAKDIIAIDLRGANANRLDVTNAGGDTVITLGTVDVTLTGVVLDESDIVFQFI